MRVLIAAGGTGGHIYPGIAVAREVMSRNPQSTVKFVGTRRGLEARLVPQQGFEIEFIESAGLKNVGLMGRLRGLTLLPKSFIQASKLIRKFRPDVVVGAGGYVTGSVLLTASLMRVPTLVMESNALPGWTNRVLARFVDKAAVSFESSLKFFGSKGVVTGNPVRREFFNVRPRVRDGNYSILVFGGSQGARAINEAMVAALPLLDQFKDRLRITHQTGEADFSRVAEGYRKSGWEQSSDVRRYIDDMVSAFDSSDLIVCRAGATTSAELVAAGRAAIMVPFPFAADDHQRKNAEELEANGAAKMVLQRDLTGERLAETIMALLNSQSLSSMEESSRKLAKVNAAEITVDLMESLAKKGKDKS
jgi:UDP-N-acetylglucosamine--N-acetylmuramyl-(pentapeptide) pyrophosphoryl-undecaprenol N-acetylglucosamine transferase